MQYRLSRMLAGPFLRLLARPEVIGAEHLPASGGAILASNHLSIMDSIFLPLMLERPVTFAAKSEYFTGTRLSERVAGAYLRATKQLSTDRAGARAAQGMLEAALALLRDGGLFGIYPEGTRSPDGRLYRGRTGVGWLALNSGVPVLPVAMIGTERILPPGRKLPRPGRIQIRIGKPLTFEAYQGEPAGARQRRAVTDEVMRAIRELSGQEYVPVYASVRKEELAASARRTGIRTGDADHDGTRWGPRGQAGRAGDCAPGRPRMTGAPWLDDTGLITLPSGIRVRGRRLSDPASPADFALILAPGPAPDWPCRFIRWPDFGLPADREDALDALREAHRRARGGQRVEVACRGGAGRTGTALAALAILDGLSPRQAVAWVRGGYHPGAIETLWQRRWLRCVR